MGRRFGRCDICSHTVLESFIHSQSGRGAAPHVLNANLNKNLNIMHGSTRSLVGLRKRQRRRGSGLRAKNWIRPTSGAEGGSQARWVDIIGIRRRPAFFVLSDGGLDQAQGFYVTNRIVFYFIL